MRRIVLFLVFGLLLVSACSKQSPESMVGQGSNVEQQTRQQQAEQQQTQQQTQATQSQQTATQPETQTQETQSPQPAQQTPEVKEFRITAKQFAFEPATIEVNKGDKVRLIVTSMDVPHGFAITEYGINQRLDPGKPVTIEFTADKEGTFTAFCSVLCGSGHSNMKGKIIVG